MKRGNTSSTQLAQMPDRGNTLKRGRAMNTKKKLYIVVLIWAAVALQIFITKRIDRESQMVTQVMSDGVENVTAAEVKLYAHYGDEPMTGAAREKILQRVGEKLGIVSGYDIIAGIEGENTSTTFVKKGENGDTTIRLISMEQTNADGSTTQENYLMTEIALKNQSTENIYRCKEQLDQIYADFGLSGSSNLYLCSQEKGRMTEDEMKKATADFFETMHAKKRNEIELQDTLCIYGYSDNVPEYVYQNDHKVNVNIAFTYDEAEDITYIHHGLPFIDKSF